MRLYYLRSHVVVLEGEGAGYAHQAENLLRGHGFESSLYARPDLEHCWLQPLLIATVYMGVRDVDTATHIISMASGTLLIVWMFLIGDRIYGRLGGWIAALLATFHPLLIALSASGYAEILAMALQFGAIYWCIRFIEHDGRWCWLFGGVLWGLSYLNRTECLVLPLFTLALFGLRAVWNKESMLLCALESVRFLTVFALLVAPYALFFYHYTGEVRFEGKNLLNYTIGQRRLEGKSLDLAGRELTPDLTERGPSLNTSAYVTYSPYPTGVQDLGRYFVKNIHRHREWLLNGLPTAPYFGSVLLFVLAFLGVVGRPWDAVGAFRHVYIVGLYAYIVFLLAAAHMEDPRYEFPLLPFLLLWASSGIGYLLAWVRQTTRALRITETLVVPTATMCILGIVVWMFQLSYKTVSVMDEFNSGWAPNDAVKQAGLWLRAHAPGSKNAYGTAVFCYYSFSYEWILPYADSATSIRYIRMKNPDYIFLDSANSQYTPYYKDWLQNGIPDRAAVIIYQKVVSPGRRLVIYQWEPSIVDRTAGGGAE